MKFSGITDCYLTAWNFLKDSAFSLRIFCSAGSVTRRNVTFPSFNGFDLAMFGSESFQD
jgi:hypothetical protein